MKFKVLLVTWILPPVCLSIFITLILEGLVRFNFLPSFLVPSPSQIAVTIVDNIGDLQAALLTTTTSTLVGLGFSLVFGVCLALALSLSDFARRAILPFAVFFQTVPIIAVAPLLVIWFGFGEPTVRASAAIVSFFPVLSNALVGLESARPEYLELFRSLGATRWQTLLKLRIPAAVRSGFAGLKVAAGLAVVGALVGEFVAGGGLGSLIDSARTQQRTDLVFACVLFSALLGVFLLGVVFILEFLVQKWRPFYES